MYFYIIEDKSSFTPKKNNEFIKIIIIKNKNKTRHTKNTIVGDTHPAMDSP